jgi:hypothetical protein
MFHAQAGDGGASFHDPPDCPYVPNQVIPVSGIYEICHKNESRVMALLLRHDFFPLCIQCGEDVRYRLVRRVAHISEDLDFELGRDNLAGR